MKSFILTVLMSVILLAGGILHTNKMKNSAEELIGYNEILTNQLQNDDFDAALSSIAELQNKLEGLESFFSTLGNHDDLDIIEQNLAELQSLTEGKQKYDALAKAYVISHLCEHLPKNLRLKTENIF